MTTSRDDVRDTMLVLFSAVYIRMEADNLTVGQAVDVLIKMLEHQGYVIEKKR